MGFFVNILISIATLAIGTVGLINYVPLSWLEIGLTEPNFGATITTINATDLIKDSRSTINTNFANLNADKVETSTTTMFLLTTLDSVTRLGVIASSTWRGSIIGVPFGGTGSSTLSANQVLLGNGTGNIGVVDGRGSSGQGLISNGGTLAPTWQAITADQTANYVWSGTHAFNNQVAYSNSINATGTTLIRQFNASSTAANPIVLNGVSYSTPSTQGASSTILKNNGSGSLIWESSLASSTQITTTGTSTWTVPAGITRVKITLVGGGGGGGGVDQSVGMSGGGGAGGYTQAWLDVSGGTGLEVFVGFGGQ